MAILGSQVDSEFIKIDTFTGDGGVTFGPLTLSVESPGQIGVHINGSYKTPSTDYTVDGSQIIFTVAPSIGSTIVVLHLGLGIVSMADISDNSISTSSFKDSVITGDKIAESSISAEGSMNAASISFTNNNLLNNTINGNNIVNGAITGNLISDYFTSANTNILATSNTLYFDGSSGIRLPTTSNLDFGSGDFTIEFWMKATSVQTLYATMADQNTTGTGLGIGISLAAGGIANKLNFTAQQSLGTISSSTTVTDNVWRHIACVKSGSNGYLFVNGVLEANTTGWSSVTNASLSDGQIGRSRYGAGIATDNTYTGFISNFRVLTGTALYTSNFTVSSNPTLLTTIENTQLLLSNASTTLSDTSNNALTLTAKNVFPTVVDDYTYQPAFIEAIKSDTIVAGEITTGLIAAGSIKANQIASGSITGDSFATSAIRANQIVTGAITGDKFTTAPGIVITGDKFKTIGPASDKPTEINGTDFNAESFMALKTAPFGGLATVLGTAFNRANIPFTITIPESAERIKITAIGGGGGSGSVISAWDNPAHPGTNACTQISLAGVSGQGGGGAGFVAYIKGPFLSKTFNVVIGEGGSGGLGSQLSNVANAGSPGTSTIIWNLLTANANISITANGGYGSNAYNALGIGVPTYSVPAGYTQAYPVYGKGGKGGIAGESNTSPSFIILHHAGFDGNVATQISPFWFPGQYFNRAFTRTAGLPSFEYEIELADYNPSARRTILGKFGQGGEMSGAFQGGFVPPSHTPSAQIAGYWNQGRKSGNPGANGAIMIEF